MLIVTQDGHLKIVKCDCSPDNDCPGRDVWSKQVWYCTRPKKHRGDHVACTNAEHSISIWPQEEDE